MIPVVLLDVDGVLNAITRKPDPNVWSRWREGSANSGTRDYPIRWAEEVAEFIGELHTSGRAEVRWHTTWQQYAQTAIEPLLGLPRFEVADAPEFTDRSHEAAAIAAGRPTWWKLPAAERVVQQEHRPLIWIDDDMRDGLRRYDIHEGFTAHQRTMFVAPDETTGLTPRYLRLITEFIDSLEG